MNQIVEQYNSTDENIALNTTKNDSLYTSKSRSNNTENNKDKSTKDKSERNNNFLRARNLMKSLNEEELFHMVDEYSEISPNLTKQENISNYVHKPLIKEIIKDGNNLIIQKPIYKFGTSINNPYNFNYNILSILINKNKKNNKIKNKIFHGLNNTKIYLNNINKLIHKNNKKPLFKSPVNLNDVSSKNEIIENKENSLLFYSKNKDVGIYNKNRIAEFISPEIEDLIKDLETPVDIKINNCQEQINIIKQNLKFGNKNKKISINNISNSNKKNINEVTTAKAEYYFNNDEDNKDNISSSISSLSKEPVVTNLMNKFDLCSKDSSIIKNRSELKSLKYEEENKILELSNDLDINGNKKNII